MTAGHWGRVLIALSLMTCAAVPASASAPSAHTVERNRFTAAQEAVKARRWRRFEELKNSLSTYPLYPYLEALSIERRLYELPVTEVTELINAFPGAPPAFELEAKLIELLGRQKRWRALADNFGPRQRIASHCWWLRANVELGRPEPIAAHGPALWLSGESRPDVCDAALEAWIESGALTNDLAWERVLLAMQAGRPGLVRYLERFLAAPERELAQVWRQGRAKPVSLLQLANMSVSPNRLQTVAGIAFSRLAARSSKQAARLMKQILGQSNHPSRIWHDAIAHVATGLAQDHSKPALKWFAKVPIETLNEKARAWRVAIHAWFGDWRGVLKSTRGADFDDRRTGAKWQYWRARAFEELGRRADAHHAFSRISDGIGYYELLAADRLGKGYNLAPASPISSPTDRNSFAAQPNARRAFELLALDRRVEARREWRILLRDAEPRERSIAAETAFAWGWNAQAVLSAARSESLADLELRFPLDFESTAQQHAQRRGLDSSWIMAVIRQESAFIQDVRSGAGAIGLMQLMPNTARAEARRQRIKRPSRSALTRPELNIALGTGYLAHLLDKLDHTPMLVSAAYNAGLKRVRKWSRSSAKVSTKMPADVWIEAIPFAETRGYLKRVMAYTVIYDHRRNQPVRKLSEWLGSVPR